MELVKRPKSKRKLPNVRALEERRSRLHRDPDPLLTQVIGLRAQGMSAQGIADTVGNGMSRDTVYRLLDRARELDLITAEDPKRAKAIIAERGTPMIIDNVLAGLAAGDKTYTIKAAESLNILPPLPKHGEGQGAAGNTFNLSVIVKMPEGRDVPTPEVVVGQIAAVPLPLTGGEHA